MLSRTRRVQTSPLRKQELERAIQFDDFEASDPDREEDGRAEYNDSFEISDEAEERSLHVGHSSNPRGVATRVVNERDEEDGGQYVTPGERFPLASRATLNFKIPMANRTLTRLCEDMKKSRWIQLFIPKAAYQATWVSLGSEFLQPLNSMSFEELDDSIMLPLRAMEYECTTWPSMLMLADFKNRSVGVEMMK
uniref:Uncharacterized protein n=1 Tax=Hyaloperonospora arabidopsidis (strain Emoy2) TaxID=559515 RepID=M4C0Y9_HYAAE